MPKNNAARSYDEMNETDAIGVDLYNQALTGWVAKTLNAVRSDSDHAPVVIIYERPEDTDSE